MKRGIRGVPAFIIGNDVVVGLDTAKIESLIDYIVVDCPKCPTRLRVLNEKKSFHCLYILIMAEIRLIRNVTVESTRAIIRIPVIRILYFIKSMANIYFDKFKAFSINKIRNITSSPLLAPFMSA